MRWRLALLVLAVALLLGGILTSLPSLSVEIQFPQEAGRTASSATDAQALGVVKAILIALCLTITAGVVFVGRWIVRKYGAKTSD